MPIFPLPDVVLFPRASLSLHIFEPRYRLMTGDALRADRLIALALLKPGWEKAYHGSPDVFPVGCAGLIEDEARLPDGRLNIRLRGIARIAIGETLQHRPYRVAAVRVLEDVNQEDDPALDDDKRRLLASCAGLLQEVSGRDAGPVVLDARLPFAIAVNTLCQSLALSPTLRRRLLEADDVRERCRTLTAFLERRWREIVLARAAGDSDPATGVH